MHFIAIRFGQKKHGSDTGSMMRLTSGFFLNFISKPHNHGRIRKT